MHKTPKLSHTNSGDNMDLNYYRNVKFYTDLKMNVDFINSVFKNDDILRFRQITTKSGEKCAVFFFDGMVNNDTLNESIVKPLLTFEEKFTHQKADYSVEHILFAAETQIVKTAEEAFRNILYGDTLLLFDGDYKAVTINTKGWRTRGISEPDNERVLTGPKEGFDESVMLNMAMIRRKLPTTDFKAEYVRFGRHTDTRAFICYLDSIVNRKALKILKSKLKTINIDGVLDTNYVTELINHNKFSIFKTAGTTERPDVVAARLLEGRIALFVDGTPVVLTVPYLFSENFQSDDDYYQNYVVASVGRFLRYLSFLIAISAPAVYLALVTHHKQLLPTSFFITVINARSDVPFGSGTECLILILIFEMLRECGIRVQKDMGSALSIVGGLVIGQASVEAKIVSAPMLIAVALSGIAGLMISRLKGAVLFCKIKLVLLSLSFGLYGYFTGMAFIFLRVFTLDSFGTDYTSGMKSISFSSLKDSLIRAPWFFMIKRPNLLSKNKIRQRRK